MKTIFLIISLMSTTVQTFSQSRIVSDYFMFKQGEKFNFKALGVDGTGKVPEMSFLCTLVKIKGGTYGTFYEYTQWGSQNQLLYFATSSAIQLIYSKNSFGGGYLDPPNTILKLPHGSAEITWIWGDTKYSSKFLASVQTSIITYEDIIVVTEESKPEFKMGTKKKYYARGVGLVKIEFYDENGKMNEMMSFEIVDY